jgi:hypothetical protein
VTSTLTAEPLTAVDRCDRCGAQAYVRVTLATGELMFCAHHGRSYTPKLKELEAQIVEEYDRLDEGETTATASAGIDG